MSISLSVSSVFTVPMFNARRKYFLSAVAKVSGDLYFIPARVCPGAVDMIESVGIDILDTARVKRALERFGERFAERILGPRELRLFTARHDKHLFLAGRFAAKEAVIKALGRFRTVRPSYAALEILPDSGGQPVLQPSPELQPELANIRTLISISHERSHAVAMALLSKDE
ncbi:MAG: holo-ACP synthase [Candidatus Zixiibacteriota bacterium]